jgi:hypothetical protein
MGVATPSLAGGSNCLYAAPNLQGVDAGAGDQHAKNHRTAPAAAGGTEALDERSNDGIIKVRSTAWPTAFGPFKDAGQRGGPSDAASQDCRLHLPLCYRSRTSSMRRPNYRPGSALRRISSRTSFTAEITALGLLIGILWPESTSWLRPRVDKAA